MNFSAAQCTGKMSARKMVTRAAALLSQFSSRTSSTAITTALNGCHHLAPASASARSRMLSCRHRSLTTAGSVSIEDRADDVLARAASVLDEVSTDEPAAEATIEDQSPAEAAAAETEDAAPAAAPVSSDPVLEQFNSLWDQYTDVLTKKGFFADRPEQTVPNSKRSEIGAVKRASLQAARDRIDILYSLPVDKLVTLSKTELPYVDRKVRCHFLSTAFMVISCNLAFVSQNFILIIAVYSSYTYSHASGQAQPFFRQPFAQDRRLWNPCMHLRTPLPGGSPSVSL